MSLHGAQGRGGVLLEKVREETAPAEDAAPPTADLAPWPSPALARPCDPVPAEGFEDGRLIDLAGALSLMRMQLAEMKQDSIAISANQVGLTWRVFVFANDDGSEMALANPEIIETSDELDYADEACLSFLGPYYPVQRRFGYGLQVQVARPASCVMRAQATSGELLEIEAEGIMARMFQHEVDHLDGMTMLDRLNRQQRRAAERRWYKMHPELAPREATVRLPKRGA